MSSSTSPGIVLARFASKSREQALPAEVVVKTKTQIIDTLAAIVSGSNLEAGRAGRKYAMARGGPVEATVIGTNHRGPVVDTALANGMSAHADESDDSHETSQTHPGCGVLPAVLAVAEWKKCSGLEFLRAVNLGYEVTIRMGNAIAPCMSFARSSLSCHAFGPLFGAGFAVGSLLKFDEKQFLILLNYLAQEASGLTTWRLDGAHTLKSYVFAGMPASNAVKAALLVDSGFTGDGDVLDPLDRNFFDSISPALALQLDLSDLGKAHKILETDIKKYSVGFPIAAPLAALEDILARNEYSPDDVDFVKLHYHADWYNVIGDQNVMPDLNIRHCLAATVVEGTLTFDASHDVTRMASASILKVAKRIQLLGELPGQDRFEARMEVSIRETICESHQGLNVLGRIQNPMSRSQVAEKATELLSTVISRDTAAQVLRLVEKIEEEADLNGLISLLCP